MPSFQDSAVLVILALLLFGPKKLPVLARQLGKLMAEFRRASNEFRSQMEEELRASEQADRQKKLAALQAAAPPTPTIAPPTERAQLPAATDDSNFDLGEHSPDADWPYPPVPNPDLTSEHYGDQAQELHAEPTQLHADPPQLAGEPEPVSAPLPIASVGEYSIMPPATGLPLARSAPASPATPTVHPPEAELETETLHG